MKNLSSSSRSAVRSTARQYRTTRGALVACTLLGLGPALAADEVCLPQRPAGLPGSSAPVETSPEPAAEAPREAGAEDAGLPTFPAATQVTGFVDTYLGFNFNRPASGDNQLRNFDSKHDQFSLNLAELAVEQAPTPERRVGFRIDADFGPAAQTVHAAEGESGRVFAQLQQVYASYLAPMGSGLRLDLGKLVTHSGAEVIETRDNWNYSRSLLFAWALPYYHFGLRAGYSPIQSLSLALYVVNGWNNTVENNRARTLGAQAVWKPGEKVTLTHNYTAGPEQPDNTHDRRHLWDTIVAWNATPSLTLLLNHDYGRDRVPDGTVTWQGLAAYVRVQARPRWALTLRGEWFEDAQGFATGTGQTLHELTLTSEHGLGSGLAARVELRRDVSSADVFETSSARRSRSQTTLTAGVVYGFASRP